jgi:hypothetical protein
VTRQRVSALVAAFAVAFASLWPLVSAARPRSPDIPVFICTQGGMQHQPGTPADAGDDFHCPLCIASGYGAVPAVPILHPAPAMHAIAVVESPVAASHQIFSSRPPPSRAPPHYS